MPTFNLRKHTQQLRARPLDLLNEGLEEHERLRPSDVSDLNDEEVGGLAERLKGMRREARHGTADGWFPRDSGSSGTSPLVNATPQFGGRWRDNMPGSGDQHINDDKDKPKDWKGPQNDIGKAEGPGSGIDVVTGPKYVVRVRINHGDNPEALMEQVEKAIGQKCDRDAGSVFVEAKNYEEAIALQRRVPKSMVEPKN